MKSNEAVVVTGMGVTSSIGQSCDTFIKNLLNGQSSFALLKREGRQKESAFIGAEIDSLDLPAQWPSSVFKDVSWSAKVAAVTLFEAWQKAGLDEVDPERIGLIVGGSNVQQRNLLLLAEKYRETPYYLRPHYGFSFLDTDLSSFCSQQFHILGPCFTVGGASASGQLACIQAIEAVLSKRVDVCIAIGALMDLSYLELYAFQALGAMAHGTQDPNTICRPFDMNRQGFVYGENCAALVFENKAHAKSRGANISAEIKSFMVCMDGNRYPDPSLDGEIKVIKEALSQAQLSATDIDYVKPHGTGSKLGDEIECQALKTCGLHQAAINTTKSVIGHGLSAAGAIEIAATILQMQTGQLHPCLNLETPLDPEFNWIQQVKSQEISHALCLSFGFGGMNTALCLQHPQVP